MIPLKDAQRRYQTGSRKNNRSWYTSVQGPRRHIVFRAAPELRDAGASKPSPRSVAVQLRGLTHHKFSLKTARAAIRSDIASLAGIRPWRCIIGSGMLCDVLTSGHRSSAASCYILLAFAPARGVSGTSQIRLYWLSGAVRLDSRHCSVGGLSERLRRRSLPSRMRLELVSQLLPRHPRREAAGARREH